MSRQQFRCFIPALAWLAIATIMGSCGGGGDDPGGISTGVLTTLKFTTQPHGVETSEPFTVAVELRSAEGRRITSLTNTVTLTLVGGGALGGSASVAAAAGVATFTGITVANAGAGLQLTAAASGITTTSNAFTATDACAPKPLGYPANFAGLNFSSLYCTADGKRATYYEFAKTTAGEARFDVYVNDGSFTPSVAVMTPAFTEFVTFPSAVAGYGYGVWWLPAGTFRLRVAAATGTPSTFRIEGRATTTGCLYHAVLPYATATYPNRIESPGNTATGDCTFPTKNYDTYVIYSTKPCTITMRGVQASFDGAMVVNDWATHQTIAADENSGGGVAGKDARITLPACNSGAGPLEIVATVADTQPLTSGDYTLVVDVLGGAAVRR